MILDTKFQLKQIILIIWIKFAQKVYFQSKTEKVNTSIEFCIFELIYNLDHNILELCSVLVQIRLTTSKAKRDI